MHAGKALTIKIRFRYDDGEDTMNLITKDGEYLLRLSPGDGGMRPNFFVYAGGAWGTQVSGPVLRKGDEVELVAVWTGESIHLFTNGLTSYASRSGEVVPTDSPVIVGKPSPWAPLALNGKIIEQSIVPQALTLVEIYRENMGISQIASTTPAQDTISNLKLWKVEGGHAEFRSGGWKATATGPVLRFFRTNLNLELQGLPELGLVIGSHAQTVQLTFVTDRGARVIELNLPDGGELGTVLQDMRAYPEWSGRLLALGVFIADRSGVTHLQAVRIETKPTLPPRLQLHLLDTTPVLPRVGRPFRLRMKLTNHGGPANQIHVSVMEGAGLTVLQSASTRDISHLNARGVEHLEWSLTHEHRGHHVMRFRVECAEAKSCYVEIPICVLPKLDSVPGTVPVPKPASTAPVSVGMMNCPLWRQGSRGGAQSGWNEITPYPQRQPALGWYDEGDPEVTDWEIRWAVEHGVEFFMPCWYRAAGNIGKPVVPWLNHWVESLSQASYADLMKYAIMWTNDAVGVANADDMMQNLLPFWIEHNFKQPNYLRREGKPVLFVFVVQKMIDDLGGEVSARRVIRLMRAACQKAGLNGLILVGANHTSPNSDNALYARVGFDAVFAYHWPTFSNQMPAAHTSRSIMNAQKKCWAGQTKSRLPAATTVSMGWDARPWDQKQPLWRLSSSEFQQLCVEARHQALKASHWAEQMVMLDNWDEFGEGHYLAPTRQYGFEYLDAIRKAFAPQAGEHTDLLPEDVGQGPYQRLFKGE